MPEERRVHLFRNGRNQALRIPREWQFDADEVLLRFEDGVLTVRPVEREGLLPRLASLEPLAVPFSDVDDSDLLPLDEPDVGRARYLLDTDTLSWLVPEPAGAIASRIAGVGVDS